MPLLLHRQTDHYQWAVWKIEETEDELIAFLPLPDKYCTQIKKFKSSSRRLEWLTIRVLLHQLTGKDIDIEYQKNGKPFLADNKTHISISHTKGYATLILSTQYEVGIDIEQFDRRVEKVTSHYMHADEIPQAYQGDKIWSLLLHWCAKETMFKCLNQENVDIVHELHIYPFDVKSEGNFQAQEFRTPQREKFIINYLLHPDFILTYTIKNNT